MRAASTSKIPSPVRRALRPAVRSAFRMQGAAWRAGKALRREWWRRWHGRRASTFESTLQHVRTRDQLPELLNRRKLLGTGVEIGVKRGRYSEFLLAHWRGRMLVSVDPWLEAPSDEYIDRANVSQPEHEQFFAETKRRLARFGNRSDVRRLTSVEAAPAFDDATLDFVYIDARHDYESVREDLETWYSKVRPGGIIAGHDYVDGSFAAGEFGVKRAVDEFFGARGLAVHGTDGRPRAAEIYPSWIVAIPE